tara:strand:+ start:5001 stop:6215 length:1215 start_codon:yes stop_codon:yes gene_type:complete
MKYLSVCSGIEAATVAWHPLGWEAAAYSEIEKFPSAVLAHHYPTVPNLGDMTKFKEWDFDSIDLLAGGTPCQSFSVAGLRKGLEDPRGNLALVYCGILDRFRPQWFVWENVPGVLSSNSGRDFGSFLGALAELGYGFAYRVLDAQYFGVAQRRKRVFVVGYLGDWRPAAEVLFEPESVRGDPAPSREKGEKIANCFTSSPSQHRSPNEDATLITTNRMVAFGEYSDDGTASAMKARDYKDATDLVVQPIAYNITFCDANGTRSDRPDGGLYVNEVSVTNTLTKAGIGTNIVQPILLGGWDYENNAHGPDDVTGLLLKGSPTGGGRPLPAIAIAQPISFSGQMSVRRLTPVECERLQGFPDGYTDIRLKDKDTPDGPRYKALGNSMAVPVMAWIGKRINDYMEKQ